MYLYIYIYLYIYLYIYIYPSSGPWPRFGDSTGDNRGSQCRFVAARCLCRCTSPGTPRSHHAASVRMDCSAFS